MRSIVPLVTIALVAACSPPPTQVADVINSDVDVISADVSTQAWLAAPLAVRVGFFGNEVAKFYADDPPRNPTQTQFDADLALELNDCVTASVEADDIPRQSIRHYVDACLAVSGMPPAAASSAAGTRS